MTWRGGIALAGLLAAAGCATAPPPPAITETRALTTAEKDVLARALPITLKDPGAAQFRWLPIVLRDGTAPIGYCAWVNGKNSYGAYTGFKRFFAMVTRGHGGVITGGAIEHIEGNPIGFGYGTTEDAIATGLLEGSCTRWGYTDFTGAI